MSNAPKHLQIAGFAGSLTPDEAALLKAYRAMPSDTQNDTLCIVEALVEPYIRPRSVLKLAHGGAR